MGLVAFSSSPQQESRLFFVDPFCLISSLVFPKPLKVVFFLLKTQKEVKNVCSMFLTNVKTER